MKKKTYKILIIVFSIFLTASAQPKVSTIEYFLDTDLGIGLNTIINVAENEDINEAIMTSIHPSTLIGYHKLYIRTKDDNNNWSHTIRKNIEIIEPSIQKNIIVGEYYLDSEPTFGSGISFEINPEETDISQAFLAQIPNNTPIGYHKLYGRVKDSYGKWSQTFRKNIQIVENANANILQIEYFFENDLEFGNNSIINIDTPEADGSWTFYVPYLAGSYNFDDALFFRVKNNNLKWSQTTILDEVDSSLGFIDITGSETLKIYPNPVKDLLYIKSKNNFKINSINIYDITGKKILHLLNNNPIINIEKLSSGLYILKLNTSIGSESYRFLKK